MHSHFVFLNRRQEFVFTPTQVIGKIICCKSRYIELKFCLLFCMGVKPGR